MTRFKHFLQDEGGSAIIEYLLVFPMVFTIFTASIESSVYMIKYVMFERSIDITVRSLRLGKLGEITHENLKKEICANGVLGRNPTKCMNVMRIWMQPVNTGNFAMGSTTAPCVDKADDINTGAPLPSNYSMGVDNEIMLVRVCMKEWPMFPTTGISVKMPVQLDGSVVMIASTTFVNEPG
jgi:hypothetical protein